ncbi:MAG TPA: hypothetical protein VM012_04170 [Flavitalea sp.]|nr:hypothetical protein [Flavitalea sp.]
MSPDIHIHELNDYHQLYNYLLVLSEDQIFKLRDIAIGVKKITSFSDSELAELETELKNRNPSRKLN